MNFVEKMMNLRTQPADETADEEPKEETTPQELVGSDTSEPIEQVQDEPQTYTKEQLNELFESKKEDWKAQWKQEFIDSLPESEKLKMQTLSKDDEIAQLKAELSKRDLQQVVIKKLDEARLPVSIEKLVQYSDEENTMKSLDEIKEIVQQCITDGINLRLRGKTPAGLGGASQNLNNTTDPFAKAFRDGFKN